MTITTHQSFVIPFEDEFKVAIVFVTEHDTKVDLFPAIIDCIWITLVCIHKVFVNDLFGSRLHSVAIIPHLRLKLYNLGA
jgi:hypothetical protein